MEKKVKPPFDIPRDRIPFNKPRNRNLIHGERRVTGGSVSIERNVPHAVSIRTNDTKKIIGGYAIRFNEKSGIMTHNKYGRYYETISDQALKNTKLTNVKCLFNHDYSKQLGSTLDDTLIIKVDDKGLWFECKVYDNRYAKILHDFVEDGMIKHCSFAFIVKDGGETWEHDTHTGLYHRTITDIETVTEISIVTNPAYPTTNVISKQLTDEQRRLQLELELMERL